MPHLLSSVDDKNDVFVYDNKPFAVSDAQLLIVRNAVESVLAIYSKFILMVADVASLI